MSAAIFARFGPLMFDLLIMFEFLLPSKLDGGDCSRTPAKFLSVLLRFMPPPLRILNVFF